MELIGIGLIALAFTILLVFAHFERKHRRRAMGLPPLERRWTPTKTGGREEPLWDPEWPWPPKGHTRVGIDQRRTPDA